MKLKKLCAGAAIAALMTTTPVLARVSKEDAQTYANCEGFDHLVVKYDMYWMDRSEWLSYKEAFLETFTPLEKRKLDKKAKAFACVCSRGPCPACGIRRSRFRGR
jgi:hypothetical protein